jgi:hypothetical protein
LTLSGVLRRFRSPLLLLCKRPRYHIVRHAIPVRIEALHRADQLPLSIELLRQVVDRVRNPVAGFARTTLRLRTSSSPKCSGSGGRA